MTKSETNNSKTGLSMQNIIDIPYPFRDPKTEANSLIATSGDFLGEINHWLFKGKKKFDENFSCLVIDNTDIAVFLAEQLRNSKSQITYLSNSQQNIDLLKSRLEARGLKNVNTVSSSIKDIEKHKLAQFDYISCIGVLNYIDSAESGFKILKGLLKPEGGMSIMLYAKYGRTGIAHIQEAIKIINKGVTSLEEQVMNAKMILSNLPTTNWFARSIDLIGENPTLSDLDIFHLFVRPDSKAYSVADIYSLVKHAGLNFVEFSYPKDRVALNHKNYIQNPELLAKIDNMPNEDLRSVSELLSGNILKHSFYVSSISDSVASVENEKNIPYFYGIQGFAEQVFDHIDKNNATPGNIMEANLTSPFVGEVKISLPILNYTKSISKAMTEGNKSIGEIIENVIAQHKEATKDSILIEIKSMFIPLISSGILLLEEKQ
jgi:SAM-dependent methyltransferase